MDSEDSAANFERIGRTNYCDLFHQTDTGLLYGLIDGKMMLLTEEHEEKGPVTVLRVQQGRYILSNGSTLTPSSEDPDLLLILPSREDFRISYDTGTVQQSVTGPVDKRQELRARIAAMQQARRKK